MSYKSKFTGAEVDDLLQKVKDGGSVTIDTELSETSMNPLANATVTAELKKKVNAVKGMGLSSNDFTDGDKDKLAGLQNYNDTEISREIAELSVEVSGLSERIENLPSGESSVFVAEFDKTTFAEIVAAYNEGKVVLCDYKKQWIARLEKVQSSQYTFQAQAYPNILRCICNDLDKWSFASYSAEHSMKALANGNVEIKINTNTAEVATPQYVENLLGVIINGDY